MYPLDPKYKSKALQLYGKSKAYAFQLYDKYKDNDFILIIPFVYLSLIVRLDRYFYLLYSGIETFPQSEDSKWYLEYAHALMADFKIGLHMNDLLYLGYNLFLTLLLALFKDPVHILFIQAVTASLSVILVFKIARMLFNRTTAVIASYYYAYSWDITLWTVYILSDSAFISLLLLSVYFLLLFIESNKRLYKILFIVTSLYTLIFRPTGIVSVAFMAVYLLINLHRTTIFDFVKKRRLVIGGFLTAAVAACFYILIGHKLEPFISSLQFNAKKVLYNIYANGWIYDKPTPHDHKFKPDYTINIGNSLILSFLVNNWNDVLILYGKRTIAFLGRWVWDTNLHSKRGILKFAEDLLPTAMFLTGTIAAIVNRRFRKASIVWLISLSVYVFCIIFFIDGMYRYKAPGIPFIIIAAAYGADRVIRLLINVAKKIYREAEPLWNKQRY